ncbi:MAG TPA: hypothetical protein DCS07_02320 [Bdellovibrionales bacterium]|nr:MAG: hypothetical protein A2Z97_00555 [Bdellovibrionales bacterium GWB1_52_6]OFZ03255.1 MAG: hypothetical protein A2X97_10045 [Bdellovibrionales bacterium GWA1_52_35]OFZ34629.1 MAG: hypothetical protein A2070_00425 [Bdellovibrionales bacterium GWC1_52_8]HAR41460.1 hypothetical protein [Bdellovibrionales bacterium]HCM40559.1 hypothetical protein [Bdellovibrionales bacterium]
MDFKLSSKVLSTVICALACTCGSQASGAVKPNFKVVIDPGHGGADHGTIFDNGKIRIAEKDVTLAIARQVVQKLKARGISAALTRNSDLGLGLQARTALANKSKANVFISIHMNSASVKGVTDAGGIETYILNNTSNSLSQRLAHFENAVQSPGSTLAGGEEVSDNLDVELILKDLRLDANLSESKLLACALQGSLTHVSRKIASKTRSSPTLQTMKDRGVKQALFYILMGADMPSALVEAGFLGNARDRSIVLSQEGREAMGIAIARAVEQFRQSKVSMETSSALSRCKVN